MFVAQWRKRSAATAGLSAPLSEKWRWTRSANWVRNSALARSFWNRRGGLWSSSKLIVLSSTFSRVRSPSQMKKWNLAGGFLHPSFHLSQQGSAADFVWRLFIVANVHGQGFQIVIEYSVWEQDKRVRS